MAFADLYQSAGATIPTQKPVAQEPVATVDKTVNVNKVKRDPTSEELRIAALNAAPTQTAQQYIDSRGGINSSGQFMDIYNDPASAKAAAEQAAAHARNVAAGKTDVSTAMSSGAFSGVTLNDTFSDSNSTLAKLIEAQNAANVTSQLQNQKLETQNRQSIMDVISARFKQYGLESLTDTIKKLAIDGASEDTITIALRESPAYKARFIGNEARAKAGLQVLAPAEYLNLEDSYRQTLRAYGLNQFDNNAYVSQFIGNDMSNTELNSRISTAVQRVQNADPAVMSQLTDYYGVNKDDLLSYVLDPKQQLANIERRVASSEIGVAGGRQGLNVSQGVAEQLAAQGVTQAEAQKGYSNIADILPTAQKLSGIYGNQPGYNQADAEQETFNGLASAQRKRLALAQTEQASFSGSSGTAKGSFSTGYLSKQNSAGKF